jgi:hypothetical protein
VTQPLRAPGPGVFIPGVFAWRSCPGTDGRLKYTSRFPLFQRLFLLLFLPHLVMALGILGVGLYGIFGAVLQIEKKPPLGAAIVMILMGLIFTPLTLILQFLRSSVLLDRIRGEVVEVTGLKILPYVPMLPMKKQVVPMAKIQAVVLRIGKRNSGTQVSLTLADNTPLEVADCRGLLEGRSLAEEVAAFASLPMKDETGAEPRTREPSQLDIPLVLRSDAAPPPAAPPAARTAEYLETPDHITVTTRPAPMLVGRGLAILLVMVALLAIGLRLHHDEPHRPTIPMRAEYSAGDPPPPSLWPWRVGVALYWIVESARGIGMVATPLAILIILVQFFARSPVRRLEVSRDGVELTSHYLGIPRRRRIPTDRLEELRIDGSDREGWVLTAISDAQVIHFGRRLPKAELAYLAGRIWQTLKGP